MMPVAAYVASDLHRAQVETLSGLVVLQFGTNWCGYCQNAHAVIEPVMALHPEMQRYLVEDGPGRPLGRAYRIKQWPTLVLLRDGVELGRLVRPQAALQTEDWLKAAIKP